MASKPKCRRLYDDKFPSWWEDGSGRVLLQEGQEDGGTEAEASSGSRDPCTVCKLRLATSDQDVERAVLGRDLQQCRICKALVLASQLLEHVMELHLKVHRCSACNTGFVKAAELAQHTTDCQRLRNLSKGSVLGSHRRHEPETTSTQYKCRFCDKTFSDKAVFETHLNKHTGPRPYYCSECKRQVATREELEWHVEHDCDGGLDLPRMLGPAGAFENAIPEARGSASTEDVLATDGGRHERDGPSC